MEVEKIAILNVNSFARHFSEHIAELESKIGPIKRFMVSPNIDSSDLAELVGNYEYIIMGTSPRLDKEFFELQTSIKLITRHGIGYNHIDIEAARDKGIYVCKERGDIERDAVAEQALSLLTACAKRIVIANEKVHNATWNVEREQLMGVQIRNKITGIVGFGNIGSRFAEIMKYGFLNDILVYDPYVDDEVIYKLGYTPVSLDLLLEKSDFVSLHCNLNESNKHIINKSTIDMMKPTSILINTARGALICEEDLVNALKEKKIAYFGADVMTYEPVESDHPILELENAIITPHVGVYNEICIYNMDQKVIEDIYRVHRGDKPLEIVNGMDNE